MYLQSFLTVPFFSNDFGSLSRSGSWSMLWWDEISEKMLHEFFIKFFSGFVAADETGLLVLAECLDGVSGGFCRSGSGMLSQLSTYVKLHLILLHLQLTILERKFYLRKFGSIRRRLRDNELWVESVNNVINCTWSIVARRSISVTFDLKNKFNFVTKANSSCFTIL